MEGKRKRIEFILGNISKVDYKIDYDEALKGVKQFPKILLNKSKEHILNKNYCEANLFLTHYREFSKIFQESFNYKSVELDKVHEDLLRYMKELRHLGHFEDNGKNTNEPRAYEGKENP